MFVSIGATKVRPHTSKGLGSIRVFQKRLRRKLVQNISGQFPAMFSKITFLLLSILAGTSVVIGQATSSAVYIVTTFSQNERFHLRSIPYDDEFPSLRGKTFVYERGSANPIYVFERGFDSVTDESNNLILSNDGEVVFHLIPWGANENRDGLKSVTLYRRGEPHKSYTEAEITGCDLKKERCNLVYSNFDAVVDRESSKWGTRDYKKAFKPGVDEKERFLSDFPIFSFDDTVYVTDSKKKVHLFDLKVGSYVRWEPFDKVFDEIRNKARLSKTQLDHYTAPVFLDFPKLKNGRDSAEGLADHLGMRIVDMSGRKDEQYKWYSFKLNSTISRDGSLEIEEIDVNDELPKEKITEFFTVNKFDSSSVPAPFDKWNIGDKYFFLRKKNDRLARQEKQQEILKQRRALEIRMTLETINRLYP